MAKVETDRGKVVARLVRSGWVSEGGAKHEKSAHAEKPRIKIMVPRHKTLTPGVARNIADAAGW
jgi:hypothetical protein